MEMGVTLPSPRLMLRDVSRSISVVFEISLGPRLWVTA